MQAISLAVPTESHAEIGVEFLKRGIHVLVEKPIASTLAEADRLIDAAISELGHIDILINNAGLGGFAPIVEMTDEQMARPAAEMAAA